MKKILEPITINGMELRNRMIVSAMVTGYVNEDGTASEKFIAYHETKAKGGWGLIITEDYIISPTAGASAPLPALYDDSQIASHQQLTARVHQAGGKIAAQLYHAGRETVSAVTGEQPVAPSAIKEPTMPEQPRALSVAEIVEIEDQFASAAERAKRAGFDAIEIHGAHGYLVEQFVSPFSNKRTDNYGGSLRNRARFALNIVAKIREKVGPDFPILYRMSVLEYVEGGLALEESKAFAQMLEEAGVDMIHCSQGVYASIETVVPPFGITRGAFVENAAAIKSVVNIPVSAVGRINDPDLAEAILCSGKADLVTMARASLADPEMPNKVKEGRYDEISRCIGCLQGCLANSNAGTGKVRCMVNPMTGMEDEYRLTPAETVKTIWVAGGGVAGCEAAIVAAKRGHNVTVFEKSACLGGQWNAAAVPMDKTEFTTLVVWQQNQLQQLGVTVKLESELTAEMVLAENPDAVILATGSNPVVPPIPGIQGPQVVLAQDVLLGKVETGQQIAVIGGGLVGAETADFLACHGKQVSVVEMMDGIMRDGEPTPKAMLLKRFAANDVGVYTSTKVTAIEEHAVVGEKDGQEVRLEGLDTIIIAIGVRSNKALEEALTGTYQGELIAVGDAKRAKNGYLGIQEAFEAGLTI
jgi:2,4-dienoyl-CoA reductase-like NADH-dependent reductase (Old Yellow Enzyme family)/pyruvate/2-oxoglutarate dehydrogenase complex dihydrolipoamide dehydrogenase (E3) component